MGKHNIGTSLFGTAWSWDTGIPVRMILSYFVQNKETKSVDVFLPM